MKALFSPYRSRSGVAIVIAIFFAFCLMILFASMIFRRSTTATHNQLSIQEKQAFFAARAAMQHFLLKAKLFPTELYDAVEFSQGKNPLCNFTEFMGTSENGQKCFETMKSDSSVYVRVYPERELDRNKKPKYFYHPLPNRDAYIRLGSYHNPDYRFLAPGLAVSDPANRYTHPKKPSKEWKPGKFLTYFVRDCSNMALNDYHFQPALEVVGAKDIKNLNHWDVARNEGYPYSLTYRVMNVNIQSIKGLRKYGEEAIEVLVEGNAKDAKGRVTKQVQKKVQKITRKGVI